MPEGLDPTSPDFTLGPLNKPASPLLTFLLKAATAAHDPNWGLGYLNDQLEEARTHRLAQASLLGAEQGGVPEQVVHTRSYGGQLLQGLGILGEPQPEPPTPEERAAALYGATQKARHDVSLMMLQKKLQGDPWAHLGTLAKISPALATAYMQRTGLLDELLKGTKIEPGTDLSQLFMDPKKVDADIEEKAKTYGHEYAQWYAKTKYGRDLTLPPTVSERRLSTAQENLAQNKADKRAEAKRKAHEKQHEANVKDLQHRKDKRTAATLKLLSDTEQEIGRLSKPGPLEGPGNVDQTRIDKLNAAIANHDRLRQDVVSKLLPDINLQGAPSKTRVGRFEVEEAPAGQ